MLMVIIAESRRVIGMLITKARNRAIIAISDQASDKANRLEKNNANGDEIIIIFVISFLVGLPCFNFI